MRKSSPVLTMEQLAKELQVSRRVVSAVLNDRCRELRVSDATRNRVREYLESSGYVRSKSALQLKNGGHNDQIGILYCGRFIDLEYLTASLSILTGEIRRRCVLSEITGVEPEQLYAGVSEYIGKGVRKLIWIHANTAHEEYQYAKKLFPLFQHLDKVVIFKFDFLHSELEKAYLESGVELVGFDSEKSYREAAALFLRLGHRAVALNDIDRVSGAPLPGNERLLTAFEESGLKVFGVQPPADTPADEVPRKVAEAIAELYWREGVEAAFIRNDLLAAQIMPQLAEHGIRVPEDVALIGFSGSPYSRYLPVPLTTFEHPVEEMCRCTMELLDEKKTPESARCHIFENKLVLRQSHGFLHREQQCERKKDEE